MLLWNIMQTFCSVKYGWIILSSFAILILYRTHLCASLTLHNWISFAYSLIFWSSLHLRTILCLLNPVSFWPKTLTCMPAISHRNKQQMTAPKNLREEESIMKEEDVFTSSRIIKWQINVYKQFRKEMEKQSCVLATSKPSPCNLNTSNFRSLETHYYWFIVIE